MTNPAESAQDKAAILCEITASSTLMLKGESPAAQRLLQEYPTIKLKSLLHQVGIFAYCTDSNCYCYPIEFMQRAPNNQKEKYKMKKLIILLVLASLAGCAGLEHQQTFQQSSPTKYPATASVMVFEYRNVDIHNIYDLLFSDFLIIGKSGFTGSYEDPRASIEFAKSIGTDVFVATSQFKGSRTSFVPMSTPTSETSYISGYNGGSPFYGTTNSYGTTTTMIPVNYDRYEQNGLYLKNINHVPPLWEKKSSDFKETSSSPMSGIWYNENYDLKMYKSGAHMVAFFNSTPKGKEKGQLDDIKMLFNPETGAGIYMMADRTPQPAQIKINKFGNLQVDIASQNETYSFARR